MLKTQKKIVVIEDRRYEVRKLPADVGSFILMRMIGAASTAAAQMSSAVAAAPAPVPEKKMSAEEMVKTLVTAALMKGSTFEEFRFIQHHVLFAVSREEGDAGFLPLMAEPGRWGGPLLEEQVGSNQALTMRLLMEVMIFNFTDFFEQGGIDGLSRPNTQLDGSL